MKKENILIIVGSIIAFIAVTTPFVVMARANQPFKLSSFEKLGTVGDFFGGTTVGLLSLASMIFVITAIVMQKEELKLQRKELGYTREELEKTREEHAITNQTMKLQQFETTFFNLINMHSNLINDLKDANGRNSGRGVIIEFLNEVNKEFRTKGYKSFLTKQINNGVLGLEILEISNFGFDEIKDYAKGSMHDFSGIIEEEFLNGNNLYKKNALIKADADLNFPLSNYIKSIRTIIRFVDDTEFEDKSKNKYLNIFFSQLTIHEITVILYFGELGNDTELGEYIYKYSSLNTKERLLDSIL